MKGKKYICELYGKKSKEQICTCMGKPVYGWGMRFYKDKDCTVLASIDPYHYIRKDKVMLMGMPKIPVRLSYRPPPLMLPIGVSRAFTSKMAPV